MAGICRTGVGSSASTPSRGSREGLASTTTLLRFLDLEALPEILLTIGSMVSDGFTQQEIADELGLSAARVSGEITRLRCALLEQLAGRVAEMDPEARRVLSRLTGTA